MLARRCQLAGGDDYELVFSAPANRRAELAALASEVAVPLWRFGHVVGGAPGCLRVLDEIGRPLTIDEKGFDHFG